MHAGYNSNYWLAQNGNCDLPTNLPKTNGITQSSRNNTCRAPPNGAQPVPRNEQFVAHTGNFTSNQITSNCHNYGTVQHGIPASGPSWPSPNYQGSTAVCSAYATAVHNPVQPQVMCSYSSQHHCENGYAMAHYKNPEVNYPPDYVARNNYTQNSEYEKRGKGSGNTQRGASKIRVKDVYTLNGVPGSAVNNNVYQPGMEHTTCPLNYLAGQSRIDNNQISKNYDQVDIASYRHYNGRLQQYEVPVNNHGESMLLNNSLHQVAQKNISWVPDPHFHNEQIRRTANDPSFNNSCVPHLEKRKTTQKTLTASSHTEKTNNTSGSNKRVKSGNPVISSSRTVDNSNTQATEDPNYVTRRVERTSGSSQNLATSNVLLSAMLQSKNATYDNLSAQAAKQRTIQVNETLNQSTSSNASNNLHSYSANVDTNVPSNRNPPTQSATTRKEDDGLGVRGVPQNCQNISSCDSSLHLSSTNINVTVPNNGNLPPFTLNEDHNAENTPTAPRYENVSPCDVPPRSASVITSVSRNTSGLIVREAQSVVSNTVDKRNKQDTSQNDITILPQPDTDDLDILFVEKKSRDFQKNEKVKAVSESRIPVVDIEAMPKCHVKLTDCLAGKKKDYFANAEEKSKKCNKQNYDSECLQISNENDEEQHPNEHEEIPKIIEIQRSVITKNRKFDEKNQYSLLPIKRPGPKSKTISGALQTTKNYSMEITKDTEMDLIKKDAGIEVQVEFQRTHNTYRTKINREKLGMLIEFLESDSKLDNSEREVVGSFKRKHQEGFDTPNRRKISKQSIVKNKNISTDTLVCRKSPTLETANRSPDNALMLKNVSSENPKKADNYKLNEADSSIPFAETNKDCTSHNNNIELKNNNVIPTPPENVIENIDEDEVEIIETDKKISSTKETPESEKRVSSSSGEKTFNRPDEASILNTIRAFQKIQRHYCMSCNINSSSDYFWINVASGELRCLNCFKKMTAKVDDDASKTKTAVEPEKTKTAVEPEKTNTAVEPEKTKINIEINRNKIHEEQKSDSIKKKREKHVDKLKRRMSLPSVLEKNESKDESAEKRNKSGTSSTEKEKRKSEEKHRRHSEKETATFLKTNYTESEDVPTTEMRKVVTENEENSDSLSGEKKKESIPLKQATTEKILENKSKDKDKKQSEVKSKEKEKHKHWAKEPTDKKKAEESSLSVVQKEGLTPDPDEPAEEIPKEDGDKKLKKPKVNNKNEILAQLYKKTKKLSWSLLSET